MQAVSAAPKCARRPRSLLSSVAASVAAAFLILAAHALLVNASESVTAFQFDKAVSVAQAPGASISESRPGPGDVLRSLTGRWNAVSSRGERFIWTIKEDGSAEAAFDTGRRTSHRISVEPDGSIEWRSETTGLTGVVTIDRDLSGAEILRVKVRDQTMTVEARRIDPRPTGSAGPTASERKQQESTERPQREQCPKELLDYAAVFRAGGKWVYESGNGTMADGRKLIQLNGGETVVNGTKVTVVNHTNVWKPKPSSGATYWACIPDGIVRVAEKLAKVDNPSEHYLNIFKNPVLVLKAPLVTGTTWRIPELDMDLEVAGVETLGLRSGSFKAIKIVSRTNQPVKSTREEWWAKEVGLIQSRLLVHQSGEIHTLQLEEYSIPVEPQRWQDRTGTERVAAISLLPFAEEMECGAVGVGVAADVDLSDDAVARIFIEKGLEYASRNCSKRANTLWIQLRRGSPLSGDTLRRPEAIGVYMRGRDGNYTFSSFRNDFPEAKRREDEGAKRQAEADKRSREWTAKCPPREPSKQASSIRTVPAPRVSDIEAHGRQLIGQYVDQFGTLVDFRKTNGETREFMGAKLYLLYFHAAAAMRQGFYFLKDNVPQAEIVRCDELRPVRGLFPNATELQAGSTYVVAGEMRFRSTENGWLYEDWQRSKFGVCGQHGVGAQECYAKILK